MTRIRLKEMMVFPVKSLAGISLHESIPEINGLPGDRSLMLCNKQGKMITQRELPELCLLRIEEEEGAWCIRAEGCEDVLRIPILDASSGELQRVKVWDDQVWARRVEDQGWFENLFGIECELVRSSGKDMRKTDSRYADSYVGFADGYPFLMITSASVRECSERAGFQISAARFRPNFLVENEVPFEEDAWKLIKIGEAIFESVKPCSRCIMTTIDPTTALMSEEPLRSLSKYRMSNNKILFGINLILKEKGKIKLEDRVEILEVF